MYTLVTFSIEAMFSMFCWYIYVHIGCLCIDDSKCTLFTILNVSTCPLYTRQQLFGICVRYIHVNRYLAYVSVIYTSAGIWHMCPLYTRQQVFGICVLKVTVQCRYTEANALTWENNITVFEFTLMTNLSAINHNEIIKRRVKITQLWIKIINLLNTMHLYGNILLGTRLSMCISTSL